MENDNSPSLPKVTIGIPTLNRVGLLRLALESALGQTYGNLEVVVSNNLSTDGTSAYLHACTDPRLVLLEQKTLLPMTANWNACLAAATGEYFLLLSDDDILKPDAILRMVAEYTRPNQDVPGIVYCGGDIIDSDGAVTRPFKASPLREPARSLITAFFEGKRDLWFCAVLLRSSDLAGGFQTSYKVACDTAVWMTAVLRRGTAAFVPDALVSYRQHRNLSSVTSLEVWRSEYKQLYKLALAEDHASSSPDPAFAVNLNQIMRQLDRSLVAGRINETYGKRKLKGILEYARHFKAFASPSGLLFLVKAVGILLLRHRGKAAIQPDIPPPDAP